MESAQYLYTDISTMNNFFNWTMTYRRDSDFYRPYGRIVKIKPHPEGAELEEYIKTFGKENKHLARGKEKHAAWFVSHCATQVYCLLQIFLYQFYLFFSYYHPDYLLKYFYSISSRVKCIPQPANETYHF